VLGCGAGLWCWAVVSDGAKTLFLKRKNEIKFFFFSAFERTSREAVMAKRE
jgi:hypothetical protein